jgi:hypothetical protein
MVVGVLKSRLSVSSKFLVGGHCRRGDVTVLEGGDNNESPSSTENSDDVGEWVVGVEVDFGNNCLWRPTLTSRM